jgi:hypothetical protein
MGGGPPLFDPPFLGENLGRFGEGGGFSGIITISFLKNRGHAYHSASMIATPLHY